jgi:hypothetical protein
MTPNLAKVRRRLEERIKVAVAHSVEELKHGHEANAAYHRAQANLYRARLFHLDTSSSPFELHCAHHGWPSTVRHQRPRYLTIVFIGTLLLMILGAAFLGTLR